MVPQYPDDWFDAVQGIRTPVPYTHADVVKLAKADTRHCHQNIVRAIKRLTKLSPSHLTKSAFQVYNRRLQTPLDTDSSKRRLYFIIPTLLHLTRWLPILSTPITHSTPAYPPPTHTSLSIVDPITTATQHYEVPRPQERMTQHGPLPTALILPSLEQKTSVLGLQLSQKFHFAPV